jgi:hypothetical protein
VCHKLFVNFFTSGREWQEKFWNKRSGASADRRKLFSYQNGGALSRRRYAISKPHTKSHGQIVIAVLRNLAVGPGLGILEIIPDKGHVQIQMPFDFKFHGGHGMMVVLSRFLFGEGALPRLDERQAMSNVSLEV